MYEGRVLCAAACVSVKAQGLGGGGGAIKTERPCRSWGGSGEGRGGGGGVRLISWIQKKCNDKYERISSNCISKAMHGWMKG